MIRKANKVTEYQQSIPSKITSQLACKSIIQTNVSNKILLGATQGIGNAILTTPLIKALTSMGLDVDVFVPDGGLLNGAEVIFEGMEGVETVYADEAEGRCYLLGLQTMWPYDDMERYVSQMRYAPNINKLWEDGINAHEVEVNMSLAYSLGYKGDIPNLYCAKNSSQIFYPDEDKKNIGIHVCRKYNHQFHANRQMHNHFEIGRELVKKGHNVYIIGHGSAVTDTEMHDNPGFTYIIDKPLGSVARVICVLDCMISEDSGIMHITAAMDTPQVALFGPTSDVKNSPWSNKSVVVRRDIECAPCQYTERALNCCNNICMDIDTSYVVQLTESLL